MFVYVFMCQFCERVKTYLKCKITHAIQTTIHRSYSQKNFAFNCDQQNELFDRPSFSLINCLGLVH